MTPSTAALVARAQAAHSAMEAQRGPGAVRTASDQPGPDLLFERLAMALGDFETNPQGPDADACAEAIRTFFAAAGSNALMFGETAPE